MDTERAELAQAGTSGAVVVYDPAEAQAAAAALLAAMSASANGYATAAVVDEYLRSVSENTKTAQLFDLARWAQFVDAASGGALLPLWAAQAGATLSGDARADYHVAAQLWQREPSTWRGVEFGLVKAFVAWMLRDGYAMGTVNRHLATVRTFANLAFQAGVLDETTVRLIATVKGLAGKKARREDEARTKAGTPTRKGGTGAKKADWTVITEDQARRLKAQPLDTPQGRRDAVLMGLLIEHGLRVGEVVGVEVAGVDLAGGKVTFWRPKVDQWQTIKLHTATLRAMRAYFDSGDVPAAGPLLRSSNKSGALTTGGMSERAATERVRVLAARIGVKGLHAHDLRHYWATYWAARVNRLPRGLLDLQEAGGWNSLDMPRRYVARAVIANAGMFGSGVGDD